MNSLIHISYKYDFSLLAQLGVHCFQLLMELVCFAMRGIIDRDMHFNIRDTVLPQLKVGGYNSITDCLTICKFGFIFL